MTGSKIRQSGQEQRWRSSVVSGARGQSLFIPQSEEPRRRPGDHQRNIHLRVCPLRNRCPGFQIRRRFQRPLRRRRSGCGNGDRSRGSLHPDRLDRENGKIGDVVSHFIRGKAFQARCVASCNHEVVTCAFLEAGDGGARHITDRNLVGVDAARRAIVNILADDIGTGAGIPGQSDILNCRSRKRD